MNNTFTLIYGCMFSGKTTKLIELFNQCNLDENEVLVVKPKIDNRFVADKINSHGGLNMPGIRIKNPEQIESYLTPKIKMVFIDEVQFFGDRIVRTIENLLWNNVQVIASGLYKDYLHQDFGPMAQLKAMANKEYELLATCHVCQQSASYTFRTVKSDEQILVGHNNIYQARCQQHWQEGMKALQD
jgi:thymidine kinase